MFAENIRARRREHFQDAWKNEVGRHLHSLLLIFLSRHMKCTGRKYIFCGPEHPISIFCVQESSKILSSTLGLVM